MNAKPALIVITVATTMAVVFNWADESVEKAEEQVSAQPCGTEYFESLEGSHRTRLLETARDHPFLQDPSKANVVRPQPWGNCTLYQYVPDLVGYSQTTDT